MWKVTALVWAKTAPGMINRENSVISGNLVWAGINPSFVVKTLADKT